MSLTVVSKQDRMGAYDQCSAWVEKAAPGT